MPIKNPGTAKCPNDENFWTKVREEFGIRSDPIYLNTGSLGLLPVQIADAVARYYRLYTAQGHEAQFSTTEQQADTRRRLATFIGADEDEIAFTRNTTEAVSAIIDGMKLNPEEEVLIPFLYISSALIASIKSVQSGERCPAYGVWCKEKQLS